MGNKIMFENDSRTVKNPKHLQKSFSALFTKKIYY